MKRITITILSCCICIACCLFALLMPTFTAYANTVSKDVFESNNSITVEKGKHLPLSTGIDDSRSGVLVSGNEDGAWFEFADNVYGEFKTEFRIFSEETGTSIFKKLTFTFTDVTSNESFNVVFSDNDLYAKISVDLKGAGQSYGRNTKGAYIGGGIDTYSSFANLANASFKFSFDPLDMKVYSYTMNSEKAMEDPFLIFDLKDESAMQLFGMKKMKSFLEYEVKVVFEDFTGQETARVLFYSLNGQSLSGVRYTDSIGPNVYAKLESNGYVGCEYTLPQAYVYDVIDGGSRYSKSAKIFDPQGSSIDLTGNRFTPQMAGIYKIVYEAILDKNGNTGKSLELPVCIYAERPSIKMFYDFLLEPIEMGVGGSLILYTVEARSDLKIDDDGKLFVTVNIYNEEEKLASFANFSKNLRYTFAKVGEYRVEYIAEYGGCFETVEYYVNVLDSAYFELENDLNLKYVRGEYLTIPSARATYNGVSTEAFGELHYPDGRISAYQTNLLDLEGRYLLRYSAKVADVIYVQDYVFTVESCSSSLFYADENVSFTNNVISPSYVDAKYNGIAVQMLENDSVLKYSSIVNLNDNTKNDTLLEMLYTPEKVGNNEIVKMEVVLTDVYDPDNFITIDINTSVSIKYMCTLFAKANKDYNPIGYNGGAVAKYQAGYNVRSTPFGKVKGYDSVSLKIQFDYANKTLWASPTVITNPMIVLDDPDYVGAGNEWEGFTTGEAYLEIRMVKKEASAITANFMLLNIDGRSLSGGVLKDEKEPVIRVDFNVNDEDNLPYAIVGKSYRLFTADINDDVDGKIYYYDVAVYDVGGVKQVLNGNTFIPKKAGKYIVEYIATDVSGKTGRKRIEIDAYDSYQDALNYEFGMNITELMVGMDYEVVDGTATGGSGVLTVERKLLFNDKEVLIEDGYFTPKAVGSYTLQYTLTDYLGTVEKAVYIMEAELSNAPIIKETNLPYSVLINKTYSFPLASAYDYLNDCEVETELYVNGEKTENGVYKVTTKQALTVYYEAKSKNDDTVVARTEPKTIKVIDPTESASFYETYFSLQNVQLIPQKLGIIFETTDDEDCVFEFINPVPSNELSFSFSIGQTEGINGDRKNNFNAVKIALIDCLDPEKKVEFLISKNEASTSSISYLQINGGTKMNVEGSFYGNTTSPFAITIDNTTGAVYDYTNNEIGKIVRFMNKKSFTGFGDTIYLSISFEGIEGPSAIVLNEISNQTFGGISADRIAPSIAVQKDYEQYVYNYGEDITVYAAKSFDLLDPETTLMVTIVSPLGKLVYSGKIDEDYSFTSTEFGTYSITYTAKDSSGRTRDLTYSLIVDDNSAPTLEVNTYLKNKYSIGESLQPLSISVSDNVTSAEELRILIYLIGPSGQIEVLEGSYELLDTGAHTLYIYVEDGMSNVTLKKYTFVVE